MRRNLASAAIIALAAWGLILLTGDYAQWIALGIGTYSAFSWVQVLAARLAAYVLNFILSIFASCWIGGAASTVNDLVMPRMRAVASAFYVLMATVGLALGPYAVGEVSDVLAAGGMASGESLRLGLLLSLATLVVPAIFLVRLLKELGPAEASRLERARAVGEPV